jgi:hypothetical protein
MRVFGEKKQKRKRERLKKIKPLSFLIKKPIKY